MATYKSPQVSADMPIQSHGLANTHTVRFPVSVSTAAVADVIQFGYVPHFARIVDATLIATDLDTGATPTVTINVGDDADVDRLFAASTVGQAGGVARMTATTGFGHRYDTPTLITGAFPAGATTAAAGTITLILSYVVEDDGVGYPD